MEIAHLPPPLALLREAPKPWSRAPADHANLHVSEVVQVALIKSSSRALQRQVNLTTAVAQERLLATHVRHVLAMVDLVADWLPFDDALDIYVRVLRLTAEQARNVGSRALAELGRRERSGGSPVVRDPVAAAGDREDREEEPLPHSAHGRSEALFSRLRKRVQGRVQEDLRYRISLGAARTEDDLLETHVENALLFVKALDGESNEADAIELYLETLMLPEGTADVVYHRALRQIADEVLPPLPTISGQGSLDETARQIEDSHHGAPD